MRFEWTDPFKAGYQRLPEDERRMFRDAAWAFNAGCDRFVETKDPSAWPSDLRVRPVSWVAPFSRVNAQFITAIPVEHQAQGWGLEGPQPLVEVQTVDPPRDPGQEDLADAFAFAGTVAAGAPVVVATSDLTVFGVEPTVTFQPQVVVTPNPYLPGPAIGLCPPPPSPVWLVKLTGAFPALVVVSANVPVVAGVWQSNVQLTVDAAGNVMASSTLLPVPDSDRYCLVPPAPVVVGADDDEPQAAATMAKSANPTRGMSVLDRLEQVPLVLLEPILAVIIWCLSGTTHH